MQRTSSCAWVKGILEMFAASGVDVPALVREVGVDPTRLDDPAQRFGADEVSRLWELAVAASGDPALGLDRALTARHVNMDVVGYAMLSCSDLRQGLARMARYMAVISDAATFELQPQGNDCWLVLGGLGYARPVPRQRYAYGMLTLLTLCQWLTRRAVSPLSVAFKFPQPPEADRYHAAFLSPLQFSQPENRLLLAADDLAAPLPSRNPSMLALHEQLLQERLAAMGGGLTSRRVSAELIRRLHRGEPRREEVAASLALADRTLQRRLHAEGTSFQDLLDDARRELASKYLADAVYSLPEVADLLGFADPSNFQRACKRWFGESAGQHRLRMAGGAQGAATLAGP